MTFNQYFSAAIAAFRKLPRAEQNFRRRIGIAPDYEVYRATWEAMQARGPVQGELNLEGDA